VIAPERCPYCGGPALKDGPCFPGYCAGAAKVADLRREIDTRGAAPRICGVPVVGGRPCGEPATWVVLWADESGHARDACEGHAEEIAPMDGADGFHSVPSPFITERCTECRAPLPGEGEQCENLIGCAAARVDHGATEEDEEDAPGPCLTCGTQCNDEGICVPCSNVERGPEVIEAAGGCVGDETGITDAVGVLLHYCERHEFDFDALAATAFAHYVTERTGREELFAAPEHIQRMELAVTLAKWRAANPATVRT
jgi:hypothetical protein